LELSEKRNVSKALYKSSFQPLFMANFGSEVRFHLRLPGSGLGEVDYPHVYPSPPQDVPDIYDQTSPSSANSRSFSSPAQTHMDRQNLQLAWYFYLAEIAMKRILNSLLVWRYDIRSGGELLDQESKDIRLQRSVVEFERQTEDWSVHFDIIASLVCKN
jgi:hypothetical protein